MTERHADQRAALLHQIQQLTAERAMFLPLMDYRHFVGVGPRVAALLRLSVADQIQLPGSGHEQGYPTRRAAAVDRPANGSVSARRSVRPRT